MDIDVFEYEIDCIIILSLLVLVLTIALVRADCKERQLINRLEEIYHVDNNNVAADRQKG